MPSDYDYCPFCRQINARQATNCLECGRPLPWAPEPMSQRVGAAELGREEPEELDNPEDGEIGAYAPGMNPPETHEVPVPVRARTIAAQDNPLDRRERAPGRRIPVLLLVGLALVFSGVLGLDFFGPGAEEGRVNFGGATPTPSGSRPKPIQGPGERDQTRIPFPPINTGSQVSGIPETLDDEVSVAAGPAYFDLPDLIQDDIDGVRLALGTTSSDGSEQPAPSQGADAFFQSWTRHGETLHVLYRMPSARVVAFYFTTAHPWPPSGLQRIITAQRLDVGDPAYTITLTHDPDDRKLCTGFLIKTR